VAGRQELTTSGFKHSASWGVNDGGHARAAARVR